jgi:hypothetical protein
MSLRGRPYVGVRSPERKPLAIYVVPKTHLLVRLLAENEGTTIGQFFDALVAGEAERRGISLGGAA